jgi:hypothetical protein
MKFVICLLVAVTNYQAAYAQEATIQPEIIEIRKSLPMEPTEKAVKDFILNRGSGAGLKAGAYVSVIRNVAVTDPVRNKALGTLNIPVGRLQIIHVESNISVARLHSELGNDERPMLEYEALMIGDQIDMNSISMDAPKTSKKKWFSATTTETTTSVAEAQPVREPVAQEPALVEKQSTELASSAPTQTVEPVQPSKTDTSEPAFILTPIPSNEEIPVKEKTSFIPEETTTVSTAATAN